MRVTACSGALLEVCVGFEFSGAAGGLGPLCFVSCSFCSLASGCCCWGSGGEREGWRGGGRDPKALAQTLGLLQLPTDMRARLRWLRSVAWLSGQITVTSITTNRLHSSSFLWLIFRIL